MSPPTLPKLSIEERWKKAMNDWDSLLMEETNGEMLMSNIYFNGLDEEYQHLYLDKLEYDGISLPDPLDTNLKFGLYKPLSQDNVPDLTFGDIYIFLVEAAKVYSRVDFKNFKSLPCYKVAMSEKVQEIFAYKCSNTEMCVLTCDIVGDESFSRLYRAWAVVSLNGVIQNGHCTCMNEFQKGCTHVAILLLSVDNCIKQGLEDKNSEDSSSETSNEKTSRLNLKNISDVKSSEKKNSSTKENISINTSMEYKEKLKAIKRIVPNAPIFTLLCESDISSDEEESEDEQIHISHELMSD